MNIDLPDNHPLAKAIVRASSDTVLDTWLLVKTSEKTYYRASLSRWERHCDGELNIDFEDWESFMERKATEVGL